VPVAGSHLTLVALEDILRLSICEVKDPR
jgi:hypothetical protein